MNVLDFYQEKLDGERLILAGTENWELIEDIKELKYDSPKVKAYLRSGAYRSLRNNRLEVDGHKCTKCGSNSNLQLHHLDYSRFFKELLTDVVTLCKRCHAAGHKMKNEIYSTSKDYSNMDHSISYMAMKKMSALPDGLNFTTDQLQAITGIKTSVLQRTMGDLRWFGFWRTKGVGGSRGKVNLITPETKYLAELTPSMHRELQRIYKKLLKKGPKISLGDFVIDPSFVKFCAARGWNHSALVKNIELSDIPTGRCYQSRSGKKSKTKESKLTGQHTVKDIIASPLQMYRDYVAGDSKAVKKAVDALREKWLPLFRGDSRVTSKIDLLESMWIPEYLKNHDTLECDRIVGQKMGCKDKQIRIWRHELGFKSSKKDRTKKEQISLPASRRAEGTQMIQYPDKRSLDTPRQTGNDFSKEQCAELLKLALESKFPQNKDLLLKNLYERMK